MKTAWKQFFRLASDAFFAWALSGMSVQKCPKMAKVFPASFSVRGGSSGAFHKHWHMRKGHCMNCEQRVTRAEFSTYNHGDWSEVGHHFGKHALVPQRRDTFKKEKRPAMRQSASKRHAASFGWLAKLSRHCNGQARSSEKRNWNYT